MTKHIILYNIAEHIGNFYVYSLCSSDNIPFYVGVGQWDRKSSRHIYEDHIKESFNPKDNSNLHKTRTIQKIINSGNNIIVNILFHYDSIDESFNKEIELVEHYGRRIDGTGILTNLTKGGDGVVGFDRSGENNPMYGKTMSNEARQKLREYHLGTNIDEKIRNKMSKTHLSRLANMTDFERAFRNSNPKKLTQTDVRYIRSVSINSRKEKEILALEFGVSIYSINDVIARRSYKWVE